MMDYAEDHGMNAKDLEKDKSKSFTEKKEEYTPNGDDFCFLRALEMVLPEKCYGSWRGWTCFGKQIMKEWLPKIKDTNNHWFDSRKKIATKFTPTVLAYLYRPGDGPLYLKAKKSFIGVSK